MTCFFFSAYQNPRSKLQIPLVLNYNTFIVSKVPFSLDNKYHDIGALAI